jgi:hypothetical protein
VFARETVRRGDRVRLAEFEGKRGLTLLFRLVDNLMPEIAYTMVLGAVLNPLGPRPLPSAINN